MTNSMWGTWGDVANHLVRMTLAFLFTLPIAWNRERGSRSAGLRTFPIVALASCGFVLLAIEVLGERSVGQARILEGVITGIGFIGGGAILKAGASTHGTATAASILNTGVVGAAVGFGYYDIGFVLALANFLVLFGLGKLKPEDAGDNIKPDD
ncbi:MgtC/SapB family protein [Variovorax sp. NFACC27]|uniref:MgtC/SapB family protein n=1 Tax=unclassified Variovorax TaxID=663243 RepID=UPI00089D93C9|nr:putative Mg2+ transporter-C (MgtC) family protein [Variovorax sp. NFACC28]SEG99007.1 putative Mg2+ transporter-C (MgtC) family protein [Variovorax sp. NFACC29]SFE16356.1 putative Mg2+ transporter-C (MgtC) family protein [Variovorax sp. NFACC26]SFH06868.1 putative Mg2+ transporter-C (MgtC) family protein [Variovorax sp. NFACC27]SEF35245.1 putative Mg2+ transporter-C (MgtC) family protein [Variovorax sp. NFACC28]